MFSHRCVRIHSHTHTHTHTPLGLPYAHTHTNTHTHTIYTARRRVSHPTTSPTRHSPHTCTLSTSHRTTGYGARLRISTGCVRNRAPTGRCSPRTRVRRRSPRRLSVQARWGRQAGRGREVREMKCNSNTGLNCDGNSGTCKGWRRDAWEALIESDK